MSLFTLIEANKAWQKVNNWEGEDLGRQTWMNAIMEECRRGKYIIYPNDVFLFEFVLPEISKRNNDFYAAVYMEDPTTLTYNEPAHTSVDDEKYIPLVYLRATHIQHKLTHKIMLEKVVTNKTKGMFRGCYVSI